MPSTSSWDRPVTLRGPSIPDTLHLVEELSSLRWFSTLARARRPGFLIRPIPSGSPYAPINRPLPMVRRPRHMPVRQEGHRHPPRHPQRKHGTILPAMRRQAHPKSPARTREGPTASRRRRLVQDDVNPRSPRLHRPWPLARPSARALKWFKGVQDGERSRRRKAKFWPQERLHN